MTTHEEQDGLEHGLDKKTIGLVKSRMVIGLDAGSAQHPLPTWKTYQIGEGLHHSQLCDIINK